MRHFIMLFLLLGSSSLHSSSHFDCPGKQAQKYIHIAQVFIENKTSLWQAVYDNNDVAVTKIITALSPYEKRLLLRLKHTSHANFIDYSPLELAEEMQWSFALKYNESAIRKNENILAVLNASVKESVGVYWSSGLEKTQCQVDETIAQMRATIGKEILERNA